MSPSFRSTMGAAEEAPHPESKLAARTAAVTERISIDEMIAIVILIKVGTSYKILGVSILQSH